jgi:hypothetical protein
MADGEEVASVGKRALNQERRRVEGHWRQLPLRFVQFSPAVRYSRPLAFIGSILIGFKEEARYLFGGRRGGRPICSSKLENLWLSTFVNGQ